MLDKGSMLEIFIRLAGAPKLSLLILPLFIHHLYQLVVWLLLLEPLLCPHDDVRTVGIDHHAVFGQMADISLFILRSKLAASTEICGKILITRGRALFRLFLFNLFFLVGADRLYLFFRSLNSCLLFFFNLIL